jgi:hypothetical protein
MFRNNSSSARPVSAEKDLDVLGVDTLDESFVKLRNKDYPNDTDIEVGLKLAFHPNLSPQLLGRTSHTR